MKAAKGSCGIINIRNGPKKRTGYLKKTVKDKKKRKYCLTNNRRRNINGHKHTRVEVKRITCGQNLVIKRRKR